MLQSVNDLKGFVIIATDGEIGNIEEFYFEDSSLVVRYLVANTGNWLTGSQNLILPQAITHLDREKRNIHVSLTKEQVTESPGIDKHQPVSRQMEKLISDYYGERYYWDERPNLTPARLETANAAAAFVRSSVNSQAGSASAPAPDVHLRSMQEIANYQIDATDGEIGMVEDFFLETDDWTLRYIGVDTQRFLPGKHVLISMQWVQQINWAMRNVTIDLTREKIRQSPDYDKVTEVSREYETRLHKHYGEESTT